MSPFGFTLLFGSKNYCRLKIKPYFKCINKVYELKVGIRFNSFFIVTTFY